MLLLNHTPVKYFKFPGGELQVKLPEKIEYDRVLLIWKPVNSDDILKLILTVDALKHAGIFDIEIDILYLPYARQDRICNPGEALSALVIVKLIDSLDVTLLRLWDIHNRDTLLLFKQTSICEMEVYDIFKRYKILDNFNLFNLVLCSPDIGALSRVNSIASRFELTAPITIIKKRNPETGKIIGINLRHYWPINARNVLIVDDICDGGTTFIESAKLLRKSGAGDLFLYVTHGIFSKGFTELKLYFKHIYCHHVLHDDIYKSNDFLTILREFPHEQ